MNTTRTIALFLLALAISDAPSALAFLAPDDQGGDEVQALIRADILPRFERCPGLVYGIEAAVSYEDPNYPAIRFWIVTIVETVQGPEGLELIEEDLTFRAMPGLVPRLVEISVPRPWPHE